MEPFNGKRGARLSPFILNLIEQVVGESTAGKLDRDARKVADLSRLFTKDRSKLTREYLNDPVHAAAYLRYFLPVNLAKIQVLLDELPQEWIGRQRDYQLHVLDVGSGPGSGALAVLDWLNQRHPDCVRHLAVVAVDSSADMLNQARRLWNGFCRESGFTRGSLTAFEGDLERPVKGGWYGQITQRAPYDLIILANCLNELFVDHVDPIGAKADLVSGLLPLLAQDGTVMIVEPALRETSRSLHHVRDRLLQEKHCTVYSPCLHEANCPALVHPDDWCHEERLWTAPAVVQAIDRQIGFIKDALKFSYLLLRKDGRTIVARSPQIFRVVSELRELKGEKRAWLCNETGRPEVGRLDRLASPKNAAVDNWHRGAIVQIERIVRKEREGKVSALGRIDQDAVVQVIRSV